MSNTRAVENFCLKSTDIETAFERFFTLCGIVLSDCREGTTNANFENLIMCKLNRFLITVHALIYGRSRESVSTKPELWPKWIA